MTLKLNHIRKDYQIDLIDENLIPIDPIVLFQAWLGEALDKNVPEATAMTLATSDSNHIVDARIVLLKEVVNGAFAWFTNYESAKGQQLAQNQAACLLFFWPALERQVRIRGLVHKIDPSRSDTYFASRPQASQIAAHCAMQSTVIPNRAALDDAHDLLSAHYLHHPIPRPAYWGGYELVPQAIEFWQGRPSRLHDRILYSLDNHVWQVNRLAP